MGGLHWYRHSLLKRQLASDLPPTGKLLADGLPEGAISHVIVQIEIWMIEEIEELEADLESDSLCDRGVLVNAKISLHKAGLAELLGLLVSVGSERGRRKLS